MDLPTALVNDIVELSTSVGQEPGSVRGPLSSLIGDLKLAVRSYCGLQLVLVDHDHAVTLSAYEHAVEVADAVTSLSLPLSALGPADPSSRIVFYASTKGAFVDLAADLTYALGLADPAGASDQAAAAADGHHGAHPTHDAHRQGIILDADVPLASTVSGLDGLAERSTINRAVGVLLDDGHHPDDARRELSRQAGAAGTDSHSYAIRILRRLTED